MQVWQGLHRCVKSCLPTASAQRAASKSSFKKKIPKWLNHYNRSHGTVESEDDFIGVPFPLALKIIRAYEIGRESGPVFARLSFKVPKDQERLRGTIPLKWYSEGDAKILAFCEDPDYAKRSGASISGSTEELVQRVQKGELEFEHVVSTPSQYKSVISLAKILGPLGMMPSVAKGTVTPDIKDAITRIKSSVELKSGDHGDTQTFIGQISLPDSHLRDNFQAAISGMRKVVAAQVGLKDARFASGLRSLVLCSSRSPGMHLRRDEFEI